MIAADLVVQRCWHIFPNLNSTKATNQLNLSSSRLCRGFSVHTGSSVEGDSMIFPNSFLSIDRISQPWQVLQPPYGDKPAVFSVQRCDSHESRRFPRLEPSQLEVAPNHRGNRLHVSHASRSQHSASVSDVPSRRPSPAPQSPMGRTSSAQAYV